MAKVWAGKWEGGRIALLKRGRRRYFLERKHHGRQYSFALKKVRTPEDAAAALYSWHEDPSGFIARHSEKRLRERGLVQGAVVLTQADVDAMTADQMRRDLAPRYIHGCRKHAAEWLKAFGSRDLRQVTRAEVHKVLAVHGGNQLKRIHAIKALCRLLVQQGRLEALQSPARFVQLPVPVPERSVREKGYVGEALTSVYALLPSQDVRDVFLLQCFTGAHTTEVARLARSLTDAKPQAKLTRVEAGGEIAGVLAVWHKRGAPHRISLGHQAWAAAMRLQQLGRAPRQDRLWRQLKAASKRAGIPQVRMGELRHSFVAAAQRGRMVSLDGGAGLSLADVAAVTGHTSTRTTQRFYNDQAVPRLLVVPLELTHADDPAWQPSVTADPANSAAP